MIKGGRTPSLLVVMLSACATNDSYYHECRAQGSGLLTHDLSGQVETYEVLREEAGEACFFTTSYIASDNGYVTGGIHVICGEPLFTFAVGLGKLPFEESAQYQARLVFGGEGRAEATAAVEVLEASGELVGDPTVVTSDYIRRFTVHAEFDCASDPEAKCDGVWTLDVAGEQGPDDVTFRRGDPD